MKVILLVSVLALFLAGPAEARSLLFATGGKNYPVSKVITLLTDMKAQLEKEGEQDEDTYEKIQCWCQSNDKEKTQAVADAQTRIADLTTTIETSAAAKARLTQEIESHKDDLSKAQGSLAELISLHEKRQAEFTAEEKDLVQSIKALEAAIIVLSKHHPEEASATALVDDGTLGSIAEVVRTQMQQHRTLLQGKITPNQRRLVLALQQQDVTPTFRSYRPQSSEIFGILREMKATFESNLSESTKEEVANAKAFEGQRVAKQEEINAISASLNEKQSKLAVAVETNARAKEDIEETRGSLTADQAFLLDLKSKCSTTEEEWTSRQKMRQEELSAIAQAIVILSTDDAHETFSRTFNAAFFTQTLSSTRSRHRESAANLLAAAAAKAGDVRLAALAGAVRIDAFTRVKQAIDGMVNELKKQKQDEVTQKDYCTVELNQNERLTLQKTSDKADADTKINGLEENIDALKTAIASINSELEELRLQIKRAGEDRELANKDFQRTITDQRETQTLLRKAIAVLRNLYAKTGAAAAAAEAPGALLQEEPAGPAAPPGFSPYKKHEGGTSVVHLLEKIALDAQAMEAEARRDEQVAQQTYEKFVRDTNASIQARVASTISKADAKADAEADLGNRKEEAKQLSATLLSLEASKRDLKLSCDFLMRNFDLRQQALDEEIEALQQAKAFLSGMQSQ